MADITHTKKMYGWSKYGGANMGLLIEDLDEWSCQACGDLQTRGLPSYMMPLDDMLREYFRVCSICKHIAITRKIACMATLMGQARPKKIVRFTDLLENL